MHLEYPAFWDKLFLSGLLSIWVSLYHLSPPPSFPLHLYFSLPSSRTLTHSFFSSSQICLFHPQSLASTKLQSIYSNKNTSIFQLKTATDLLKKKKIIYRHSSLTHLFSACPACSRHWTKLLWRKRQVNCLKRVYNFWKVYGHETDIFRVASVQKYCLP